MLGSLCLGIPFVLRTVCPALEIYPSIVFPARATLVDVSDSDITYSQLELYGLKNGNEVRLDPISFLDPIPLQYLGVLFERDFGLDPEKPKQVYFKYLSIPNIQIDRSKITAEERAETEKWLQERLIEESCAADTLILRKRKSSIDRSSGEMTQTELLYEKYITLD